MSYVYEHLYGNYIYKTDPSQKHLDNIIFTIKINKREISSLIIFCP